MARNLQSKLSPSDKVSIFDVNPQAMEGLKAEMAAVPQGAVAELAASAFDASKDAVSVPLTCWLCPTDCGAAFSVMSTIVLSMI
jgi:3-hydroxyisobutyrate/3-hydroxypropionate dehydrogenase